MTRLLKIFGILLIAGCSQLSAQLVTTGSPTVSANALVSNIIGSGITFSNATYTGRPVAVGTFNGAASNIGLNSGVIITTGHINVAPGPNNNAGATFSNNGPAIPALESLARTTTFDGAILEFDFVPQSDFISFRYVFASEEYNEYVCSEFNDAFAFFISGPGIVGAENLAMVPSTNIPVTINTINNGSIGALGSAANSPCELGNSAYFVQNTGNTVQYDGFTTVLTAQRSVIPCQTYHIRLMIADGADDIFDSAVFLEENSFSSSTYALSVSTTFNDSTVIEGCTPATVSFSRPEPDPFPLTITYTVSGTATPGVDYAPLPGSITIPAGQTTASFSISGFEDGINEGTETIVITANTACGTIPETIYLRDKPDININAPDQGICDGMGPAVLIATASGGVAPYDYSWSTGASGSSISVNPAVPTSYTVTVTDFCGTVATATPMVHIAAIPTASIDAPPYVCSGIPATVRYTGTASPAATYIWDFDNPATVSSGSSQGPYQVSWDSSGTKTISMQVIENGCSSVVVTTQVIVNPTPTAEMVVDPVVCAGQIATVTYTGTGTEGGSYGWGFPGGVIVTGGRRGPFEIRWDSVGVFGITLTVTENGCTSPGTEVFVNVRPTPVSGFTVQSPVCVGQPATISYSGAPSGSATYNWNFAGGTVISGSGAGPYQVSWNTPGTRNLFLSVTDYGCSGLTTSRPVVVNGIPSNNFSVASPVCAGQPTTVTYTGNAGAGANFSWNFGNGTIHSGSGPGPFTISWANPGDYQVTLGVSDNGCSSPPHSQNVRVNAIPVAAFSVESPVCVGESSTISFVGPSLPGMEFTWDFNGGEQLSGTGGGPLEVYWSVPGTRVVTLSVRSPEGCPSTPQTRNVVVNPTPTAVFNVETPICLNESSTITYVGTGNPTAQYNWEFNGGNVVFGSGQGPYEVSWNTPGIKTISLSVSENGCISPVTTQQVNVKPLPTGFFTVVSPVCAHNSTTLMYSGSAATNAFFDWNFDNGVVVSGTGGGPIQVYWENAGPKQISLRVVENGCSSIVQSNVVEVTPIPTNSFTVESPLCIGENSMVTYTGNAFPNADYSWNFGDAQVLSGSGRGPYRLTWDSPGTKTITLNISQGGCPGPAATREVTVYPIPESPFVANEQVCLGAPAQIQYSGSSGATASYSWNFGGGVIRSGSGAGPFEVHWNSPGSKTISLTVSENGCVSPPTSFQVNVIPYPTSDFHASPLSCQGAATTVSYTGTSLPGAIFDWNFDGAEIESGSGAGPYQLRWDIPGEKTIQLSVRQSECASSPSSVLLLVAPTPEANAGDDRLICSGETGSLGLSPVNGLAYQWSPPDGLANSSVANPEFVLHNLSNDTVTHTYIVRTTLGNCSAFDTVQVAVMPLPRVSWELPSGQCFLNNNFRFEMIGNIGENASWQWDFGQGATPRYSDQARPENIRFSNPGTHYISLRIQDQGCGSPFYQDSIQVYEMPVASFGAAKLEGCPPLNPELSNTSFGNGNLNFLWDFGKGFTRNGFLPDFEYRYSGDYSISLTVTNEFGCASTYTHHSQIRVYPEPRAGFTVNPDRLTTDQPLANIFDQSVGATTWEFTTGTGERIYQRNFSHFYYEPGSYKLTQKVTNEYGCVDTAVFQLKVDPVMTFFLPNAFTPNDDGDNDGFRCYGLNIEDFRMEIYNRWGELVFESNNLEEEWNGRLFNKQENPVSQMDVYAVVVYVRDSFNGPVKRIDHRVTLVK